ncbi:MAG: amidase [Nitrososphaerales archaeon]
MTSPFDLGVVELLDRFGAGTLLPSEAVEACIERIDAVDGRVNAVVTMAVKPAHLDAAESDRRWRDGEARALEGVPYGLKDIIDTAGLRTTGGSILYADRVPTADAGVVTALRAAGAVLVAKLQTYEFAYGGNPHFGPAHNPWNLAHTPGGSSEGPAAALAARELPLTIGTDTGGSIRIPA